MYVRSNSLKYQPALTVGNTNSFCLIIKPTTYRNILEFYIRSTQKNTKLAGQIVATFSGLLWNSEDIKQVLPMFYVINDFLFTVVSDVNEKLNHKFMNNM